MRHPNDEELLAFLAGRLRLKRIASLAQHVDGCLGCRTLLLALAKTEAAAPPPKASPGVPIARPSRP